MKTIKFELEIQDVVLIIALETTAIVVGYYYGETGIQYQVAYWYEGSRNTAYMYKEELGTTSKKAKGIGF